MPVQPPDPTELNRVAQRYGLGLSEEDISSFSPMVHGLLASWDAVEELYAASAPAMPERTWTRPEPADNPYNAWYVTCTVTGSRGGPTRREDRRGEGQHRGRGRPDDERLADPRGLRPAA